MSANWEQYFERKNTTVDGKNIEYYEYKDKQSKTLPDNLPMPPTDTFYYMFNYCKGLQDISALANWNVSNVKDMRGMFRYCTFKNITALANWNTSKVENMRDMFYACRQLQDITALTNWNTSKVENMVGMFHNCNQLKDITSLAKWDVSNVKDMCAMFYDCRQLKDISALANWDVSNVERMSIMFYECRQLKDISALANWDVSNVGNMKEMFSCCEQLKIPYNTDSIKSYLRNLPKCAYPKQDHTQLPQSSLDRIEPRLKDTTPLNNHFRGYTKFTLTDLPSDWQIIETIQWNP